MSVSLILDMAMTAVCRRGFFAFAKNSTLIFSTGCLPLRHRCSWSLLHVANTQQGHGGVRDAHRTMTLDSAPLLQPSSLITVPSRTPTFFTKLPQQALWDGVTGVSNSGRKRGRGKRVGRKKQTNLNRGQILGLGYSNMQWPGLNAPIIKGRELVQRRQLPPNPSRDTELVKLRDEMGRIRHKGEPPLLRGYSGSRFPGKSVGPPDPIGEYMFDGFDSRVLEFKLVSNMTGTLGRKHQFSAFVAVGNKNGLIGYGLGKSQKGPSAIRVAKNMAAQRLMYIPRYDDHTVFHNMYTKYHKTKMFVHKKQKGYGLDCHRVLKTLCGLIGISDLHAKVEGSTKNVQAMTKGFVSALINQESHADLAKRLKVNVVEMSVARDNLPVVIATPENGSRSTPLTDENEDLEMDYERLYYGGRVEYIRKPLPPFFHKQKSYVKKCKIVHSQRNQRHAQVMRLANLA